MAWTACECGCGWEGLDDVTQWLIEEAAHEGDEMRERMVALHRDERADGASMAPAKQQVSPHEALAQRHAELMAGMRR